MKEKQGFTLIELLAVIVILAVIALIATPLIMGMITKAKKNAFKDTAYGILKAGEKYTAEILLESENTYPGEIISIPESSFNKKLDYKGQVPKGGQMMINGNGDISIVIYNDSFCAIKNASDKEVKVDKYNKDTCKLNSFLNHEIVSKNTAGNTEGLFTDDFGNTRYRGSNSEVKNYITYNNEVWRMIGVFDGRVKIIRNESVGLMKWNSADTSNNWNTSTMKAYLNGEYYNGLSSIAKSQAEDFKYYLGGHNSTEGIYSKTMYEIERGTTVYPGNPTSTKQAVGLMYPSDYGYAARSSCTKDFWNYEKDVNCSSEGNWLYMGKTQWLVTSYTDNTSHVFYVTNAGRISSGYYVTSSFLTRPVVYLKTSISVTGGNGTSENPYTIN